MPRSSYTNPAGEQARRPRAPTTKRRPIGERARRHHASTARAGASAQIKPSHTGTPKTLARASPITLLRTAEARSTDTEPHWSPTRQVVRAQLFSSHAIRGSLATQSTRPQPTAPAVVLGERNQRKESDTSASQLEGQINAAANAQAQGLRSSDA